MTAATVIDVTVQTFEQEVVERSMATPVLLDFWSASCGPCKTFGPILEKVAADYGGAFVAGKVDADQEIELCQAFSVQSIPFCVLIAGGRPVDAFNQALSEPELVEFLAKNGIQPEGGVVEEEVDPDGPQARLDRAQAAAQSGDAAGVREALQGFPEESELHVDRDNLLAGLEFLEATLDPAVPAAAQLATAREHFLAGNLEPALAAIVESAMLDRAYGGGLARKAMMLMQGCLGPMDLVDTYRRRLATALY